MQLRASEWIDRLAKGARSQDRAPFLIARAAAEPPVPSASGARTAADLADTWAPMAQNKHGLKPEQAQRFAVVMGRAPSKDHKLHDGVQRR